MAPQAIYYRIKPGNRRVSEYTLYRDVDWDNFDSVVDAFDERVNEWYLKPAEALSEHRHDFALMAILCVLIDTLSQFEEGKSRSSQSCFKKYARLRIDGAKDSVEPAIPRTEPKRKQEIERRDIRDFADALYHAFRCGILHEAHVEAYGLVRRDHESPARIFWTEQDLTDWSNDNNSWTPMLSVLIDPEALRLKVLDVYRAYIARLKDPAEAILRRNFVAKFEASFGVEITDKSVKG